MTPPTPQRTVIAFMGHNVCIGQRELRRFRNLAVGLDARVVVVDAPGRGFGGRRLSQSERAGLRTGSFREVAAGMLDAVTSAGIDVATSPRLVLLGYSMGASLAAAAAVQLPRASELVFVEPVAIREWRGVELWRASRAAAGPAVSDWSPKSTPDLLRLAAALRHPGLADDVVAANTVAARRVLLFHGTTSRLSEPRVVGGIARDLRLRGVEHVAVAPLRGDHALWDCPATLGRLCDVGRTWLR